MSKIDVFHQCGHNDVWNFDIFTQDKIGDGLIFGPKMASSNKITQRDDKLKQRSLFDPQFYYPRSKLQKFAMFDFFPDVISDGYSTINFEESCFESAVKCVDFQLSQDYKFIIIPTVVYDETPQNYLEILKNLYIDPYLQACGSAGSSNKKVLLSIVIKDSQLTDENFTNELLNFITGYTEIDGVYLVPFQKSISKRVKDIDYILNMLYFINALKENELYVHLAYVDIEGLLYSVTGIDSVSIGVFENTRKFNLENFKERKNDSHQKGPKRRIYSSKLLQWIDFDYLGAMKDIDFFPELFDNNKYVNFSTPDQYNWHLKFPELYKHYMTSIYSQYKLLPDDFNERCNELRKVIKEGIELYNKIENEGVLFNNDSNGDHLYKWYTAITKFSKYVKGE
ncbi:hypothetical protein HYG86_04915 [Alkalicella caledoniensis]|uniref:Uncharacterized protein n=1 Tax=Alkalicella caledoniensis TaxID=2731377 RepID=A0A7G9W645_ALKCA|nr:hypothetical protein [Alkalicella caledoniensis]QNO14157.1 hypothetical protein HYG86_04915 [Alkalicella caledoniensis]